MLNAHQLTRACREPGFKPSLAAADPPAFMTVPTTCARAAVRQLHAHGAAAARAYLAQSRVGQWANHANPSMSSNNQNVLDGFDWYIAEDAGDGRPMKAIDQVAV